jgi:hypothetical protein
MAIWLRGGRHRSHPFGADPPARGAGVVLAVRRTGRAARQSVAHARRVAARPRNVDGVRPGSTAARDRASRTGNPSGRRRASQSVAQPVAGRAAPRGAPPRGTPCRPAATGNQAHACIQAPTTRLEATPQRRQANPPQTGCQRSRALDAKSLTRRGRTVSPDVGSSGVRVVRMSWRPDWREGRQWRRSRPVTVPARADGRRAPASSRPSARARFRSNRR